MRRQHLIWLVPAVLTACTGADPVPVASNDSTTTISAPTTVRPPTVRPPTVRPSTAVAPTSAMSDQLDYFARTVGASTVLVRDIDGIHLWRNDRASLVTSDADTWVWSDGSFLYQKVFGEDDQRPAAIASTFDGEVVCEVSGTLQHVTERNDGSFVAATERLRFDELGFDQVAVPRFAVDCATGEQQPIDPIHFYGGDGEWEYLQHIGDLTFHHFGDAEGNADVFNDAGISVNGDDYAGSHVFNPKGSLLVYGTTDWGPARSSRDTSSGPTLSPAAASGHTSSRLSSATWHSSMISE